MARVGVGDKYHISLNGVGYLFRGQTYRKKDARIFGNRFGSGEMGESDLDTFKVIQQSDFKGGCFQERFKDDTMVSALENLAYNPLDEMIHPTPVNQSPGTGLPTGWRLSAFYNSVDYKGVFYTIVNFYQAGSKSYLYKLVGTTWTLVKNDFSTWVGEMVTFNGYLYCSLFTGNLMRFDGTSWVSQPGGTSYRHIAVFNGKLYGSGDPGDGSKTFLYSFDGTTSSQIGIVGDKDVPVDAMFVFNHRLYICKADGLFAYDGVQISCVIDLSTNQVGINSPVVHDGFIYYLQSGKLYRFNGSTVECIWDTIKSRSALTILSAGGYLWAWGTQPGGYVTSEGKGGSVTIPSTDLVLYRYNGYGWSLYTSLAGSGIGGISFNPVDGRIYISGSGVTSVSDAPCYAVQTELATDVGTATNTGTVLSSIIDCGFDNITKVLDSVAVDTENMVAGDSISVAYRTFDGYEWSTFNALGTITSTSGNKLLLADTAFNTVFKRIQFKISLTRITNSICAIRGYSAKYFLSPDYKREWSMTLLCQGEASNPLELVNQDLETKTAIQLRDNIYLSRISPTPISFEDIDYTYLIGAHNNAVTTFGIDSSAGYSPSGYFKIDDEIIKYTGRTANSFTGCTRARFGTAAASHADRSIVTPYYRVILSDISNESVIVPASTEETFGTTSELTVLLKEV